MPFLPKPISKFAFDLRNDGCYGKDLLDGEGYVSTLVTLVFTDGLYGICEVDSELAREAVIELAERGCSIDELDVNGYAPIHVAFSNFDKDPELAVTLTALGLTYICRCPVA